MFCDKIICQLFQTQQFISRFSRADNEHSTAATGPNFTLLKNWAALSIIVYNKLREYVT